jgi:hypothetical protein
MALGRCAALLACALSCDEPPPSAAHPHDDLLRMSQIQALGTHNSYHLEPPGNQLIDWRYTHVPLAQQLGEQGIRQFEFDVYYASADHRFDVLHIGIVDAETRCADLRICLAEIRVWSDEHRGHQPIFIMIEPKAPYDEAGADTFLADLDAVVGSAFGGGRLITPDEVRGDFETLREAVTSRGWPTMASGRGRVVVWMDNWGAWARHYSAGLTSLAGKKLFVVSATDAAVAAITNFNDPVANQEAIGAAVVAGFIVRSRADGPAAFYAGISTKLDAALRSGAQLISTDFPAAVDGLAAASIPGGSPSRCNPLIAPSGCVAHWIEDPARLTGQ